jgi:hypothetical protein
MDGVTGVPRLTGVLNEINSWYTNKAVLHQLRDITYSRETKWQIILPSNKMWGIRHRFLGSIDYLEKELAILDIHNRPVGMMVGTQEINWSNIPPADHPPSKLISNGSWNTEIKTYNNDWKGIIEDPDVARIGNQIMVFDFDDTRDLRIPFDNALDIYNYLRDKDINPSFIFSGNKGFHIWVHPEDIQKLIPVEVMTKVHTLQSWGRLLAGVVKEIVEEVLGSAHPIADLSPNYMQGMVRCPYSIHEKSGQVVWPLDQEEIINLDLNLEEGSLATDVAGLLHTWVSCFPGYDGKITHHPPHSKMFRRTLDSLRYENA